MKKVKMILGVALAMLSGSATFHIAAITLIMASLFACGQKAETLSEVDIDQTPINEKDVEQSSVGEEDANKTFFAKLHSAPFLETSKEHLPKWLLSQIEVIENSPLSSAKIYKGEWQKQVVYFIRDVYSSCIMCDLYYENGNTMSASVHFCLQSENWAVIYRYGGSEIDML